MRLLLLLLRLMLLQELLELHVQRPSVYDTRAPLRGDASVHLQPGLQDPLPEVPAGPDAILRRDHDIGVHSKFDLSG